MEAVKSPSLEVFKNSGDVALRDMVSGHRLGLILVVLAVSSNCNDPMIPYRDMVYWAGQ